MGWQPLDLSPDEVDITQLLKQCRYIYWQIVLQIYVFLIQLFYPLSNLKAILNSKRLKCALSTMTRIEMDVPQWVILCSKI